MNVTDLVRYSTPSIQGRGHGKSEGDTRSSRATSMASHLGVERQDMIELFDSHQTTGACLVVKMLSVVGVPTLALIVLSSLLLYNSVSTHRQSNVAIDELRVFYQVDELVTNLQVLASRIILYISYIPFTRFSVSNILVCFTSILSILMYSSR